jgi:hypothetical protein
MFDSVKQVMPGGAIATYIRDCDLGNTEAERSFLEAYRSVISKDQFLDDELRDYVTSNGTELQRRNYEFDLDDGNNEYLADLHPEGVSGHVSLLGFCGLFFVYYDNYGEGDELFGPFAELSTAKDAFEATEAFNEPARSQRRD